MQEIKNQNQKTSILKSYDWSGNYRLYDCYTSPSINKIQAYEYCMDLMKKYNGHGLKILSFNLFHFSVGFYGEMNGRKAFFYITKSYDRFFYLED